MALQPVVIAAILSFVAGLVVASFGDTSGQTIRVVGEAQRPAAVPYRAGMTVLDVMVAVGGLTPYAAGNRAVLVRGRNEATYGLHLGDLLHRGDIAANVPMQPGDIVMIPQSPL